MQNILVGKESSVIEDDKLIMSNREKGNKFLHYAEN